LEIRPLDSRKLQKQLESVIPLDRVLARERIPVQYRFDALRPYRPYPNLRKRGYKPTILVRPETTVEVSEILKLARKARAPIVPYGSGTGLMGAAIAIRGGIMVDMQRMSRIEEISKEDMIVRAQTGIVLEELFTGLQKHGLFFAHDPWTRPVARLGGAISTNSLGYLGAKYGSMGTQLHGLEAVMPDGRVLRTRASEFSSTGFDLKKLFIGTEGMFGIVTSAAVRAFPQPERFTLVSYHFPSFEDGFRAITALRSTGIKPSMIDYGEEAPRDRATSELNLAYDGLDGEVESQLKATERVMRACTGQRLGDERAREFWEHRHDIALMYSRRISKKLPAEEPLTKYDYIHLSLPASKILECRREILRIARAGKVSVLEVGLWHGPELLSLVLSSRAADAKSASRKLWRVSNMIIRHAQDLGGSMEFCHGVGLKLAHLMEREHGLGLEIMRQLKKAIDPLGIMNPGKQSI
jgi:FAD/FMN-containing dehydrogenase